MFVILLCQLCSGSISSDYQLQMFFWLKCFTFHADTACNSGGMVANSESSLVGLSIFASVDSDLIAVGFLVCIEKRILVGGD